MQIIYKNKDERDGSQKTDLVDIIIYTEKISRYLEGKYARRFGRGVVGV